MLRAGAVGSSFALLGCGKSPVENLVAAPRGNRFRTDRALLYDTYAISLYFDGSQGPKTGIIAVSYVLANEPVTLDFWHGHGGVLHRYTVGPEHFSQMKKLKKTTLETTIVESHSHKLFIDTSDARFRVPGAVGIAVPDEGDGGL